MSLTAEARLRVADPHDLMQRVAAHLTEHGTPIAGEAGRRVIAFPFGEVGLAVEDGLLLLRASASAIEGLLTARASLASHVLEFASGEPPGIVWTGDGMDVAIPPSYRELTVLSAEMVTPHMRRVHFAADDLARFAAIGNMHVRLAFPTAGAAMPKPRLGPNGLPAWPADRPKPVQRKYTVRTIDVGRGRLAVDFVLHDDPGPGSAWALAAKAGDRIGMSGPGGLGLVDADWHLFACDETGLPAVARMLEVLPGTARGLAIIEVADAGERQDLAHPQGVEVVWLLRSTDGAAPGAALLGRARLVVPPGEGRIHVWAAAEFDTFKALRAHLRQNLGLTTEQHLVVSYWRQGEAQSA